MRGQLKLQYLVIYDFFRKTKTPMFINTYFILISDKEGPVYTVAWSPKNTEFCVVYGLIPTKATVFNLKCEPIFDMGGGHRNSIYYNPQGNNILFIFNNLYISI